MLHPWWPVLWHWPRALDPVSWLWLSAKGYALTSSLGLGWLVTFAALWLHTRCDTPRCLHKARHPTADGLHKLCRTCHPDLPDRKLTLPEIHERHHQAKENR